MARYQRNGQLDSLLAARSFLNKHQNNPALADHQKRLEQWARRRFSEEMNTGEALYARGQYREAYRIWKQVAPLYPDNEELNKKLERSRRVLANLRSLQDN
jgi:tetratricopeptide (TPR) repeat protein